MKSTVTNEETVLDRKYVMRLVYEMPAHIPISCQWENANSPSLWGRGAGKHKVLKPSKFEFELFPS